MVFRSPASLIRFAEEQEQAEERKAKVRRMSNILRDAFIVVVSTLKLLVIFFFKLEEPRNEMLGQEELFWATGRERTCVRQYHSCSDQEYYQDRDHHHDQDHDQD